jgi:hypothetical protein
MKMKRILITVLIMTLFIGMIGVIGYTEHRYTKENCVVVMVENDEITVEDNLGCGWTFYGEGFKKGDKVNLKMFDSCTGTNTDDVIEGVERVD